MADSILTRLRESTATAHEEMENQMDMQSACKDVGQYRRILSNFLGYYEPLEARLKVLPGMEGRSKIAWLEQDLRNLGMTDEEITKLPRCDFSPALKTDDEAMGCAYVLEGATLGGRQISAWLKDSNVPENARRFFASYGPEVGNKWREFCAQLENFQTNGGDTDAAVGAANDTFSSLGQWMKQHA